MVTAIDIMKNKNDFFSLALEAGYKVSAIARATGIDDTKLYNVKRGKSSLTPDENQSIRDAFSHLDESAESSKIRELKEDLSELKEKNKELKESLIDAQDKILALQEDKIRLLQKLDGLIR